MIDDVINFIYDNSSLYTPFQKESLRHALEDHLKYGTLMIWTDIKGIASICRWNFDNEETMYVVDVIIREDLHDRGILKYMIKFGKERYPTLKYIRFQRELKPRSEFRTLPINRILKET